jgi:leucine-rich PPR motif-containing protein
MFKVLSALVRDGHRPDVVTYTTLLKHFGKRGDVVAARWLMREMEADANVRVDASAVNALVDALCRGGRTREATEVARAMRDDRSDATLRPDANTYGALLDGFARVGDDRSAAALYAALKRRGEGADGRGWSPSWCDDEEKEKDFSEKDFSEKDFSGATTTTERVPAERVSASARAPDARMRAAVVAACAASVARRSAEARASPVGVQGTPSSRVAGVVEAVIADAAAADAAGAAAEAVALRERWRRESTRAGVEAGRTVRRVRANARGARGDETVAQNDGGSRRERRRNARAVRAASANADVNDETLRSDTSPDGVTRGMEMWKHWLGLPSRYYAPGGESLERLESDVESDDIVAPVSATTESFAESFAESTAVDSTTGKNSAEKRYTRAEIAEAVRTLRAAASKKFPGDPETALRAALDAAGEGDAGRVVFTDDDP